MFIYNKYYNYNNMFDEKDQNTNSQVNKTPDNLADNNNFLDKDLSNIEENNIQKTEKKEDLPEDIFEDVDKVENSNRNNVSDLNNVPNKTSKIPKKPKNKKVLLFSLIIIAIAGVLIFLLLTNLPKNKTINNNPETENPGLESLIENTPNIEVENDYLLEEELNPNVSNEEEDEIINNNIEVDISVLDSDGDGLTDYQETEIWGTDPYNPDTDGDGYSDFDEIKSGYNPLGEGKLE